VQSITNLNLHVFNTVEEAKDGFVSA
jgi:hypothetical protein